MKEIRHDKRRAPSQMEASAPLKSSKEIVAPPFQYISRECLTVLKWMLVKKDESGTMTCDAVVANAEGSKCPVTPTASSPAPVTPAAGVKRGCRGDRGGRGVRRA